VAGGRGSGHDREVSAPTASPLRELAALGAALAELRLPLELPGASAARTARDALASQLTDYIVPRYEQIDAPVLAVVGGSTGAGKSTLVNALVGQEVTRTGAIRPTTRDPVLVHHPDDAPWFTGPRILPGLPRVHDSRDPREARQGGREQADPSLPAGLVLVPSTAVGPGLALLDAPDVDSVVEANRRLAAQLLAAADLWLFVTSAHRYADAVPWTLLRDAAARDVEVAVVLDRIRVQDVAEIREDLQAMLVAEGLGSAPLFVVLESPKGPDGLLPRSVVGDVTQWLSRLAGDASARAAVVRRTLAGAVSSLAARTENLATAADAQAAALARLHARVDEAYDAATDHVIAGTEDGSLLRGEVLARWQEFVGTGELFRSLQGRVAVLRDRVTAFVRGEPAPVAAVEVAIEQGVASLLVDEANAAAERAQAALLEDPAGRAVLAGRDLARASDDFSRLAAAEIRRWQDALLDLVRTEGQSRRTTARLLAFGVNGVGVALMIVAFASTGGLIGAEIGIAGGTAVVGQKILEAIFGDQAVRRLAQMAREDLRTRCVRLMGAERDRFAQVLDAAGVDQAAGARLRALARAARDQASPAEDR
jgi:hypothetical protein